MDDGLREAVERVRARVEAAKSTTPFADLEARVAQADVPRNFFAAVTRRAHPMHVSIIAQIERTAEPAHGTGPEAIDRWGIVGIARRYHDGGAAAISMVTQEGRGPSLADIEPVRAAVPLPVLRNEVLIDPWQLWESRAAGADAVLLIAECLTEGQLVDMLILAQQLGLTTLLEVRSTEGLLRARPYVGFPHRAYSLLGIHNRALGAESAGRSPGQTPPAQGDVAGTLRLLDLVDDPGVLVSEGGVRGRDDIQRLARQGVRIVLCGPEALDRTDPAAALRELNGLRVR